MTQGTQSQCSVTTWRDRVWREAARGFRMKGHMYKGEGVEGGRKGLQDEGDTCIPMADSKKPHNIVK